MECIKHCGRSSRNGSNYCEECWAPIQADFDARRALQARLQSPVPTGAILGIIGILAGAVLIVKLLR